jgi:hypothetical protein
MQSRTGLAMNSMKRQIGIVEFVFGTALFLVAAYLMS